MAWNPNLLYGTTLWSGSPQLITQTQLTSSVSSLTNNIYITSNALQQEIDALSVSTGSAASWSLYPATSTVTFKNNSLLSTTWITSKNISTLALQVSSINGTEFYINNSTGTVTIAGITINQGNITTSGSKISDAGSGKGSGNSVLGTLNSAVGATMDTVTKTQQAISGVLNNTGSVLFQTYWGVETAGAVIDLANKTVTLATNAQALYDSRTINTISGSGVPGQTTNVYETINGTTQLQFSTLGAPTWTVFRTTSSFYTGQTGFQPNTTFGQEIFTSTLLPAGCKAIRSVSDPLQHMIMSTQLLSTNNYLQSFGQWHAILEPDYNLYASTLTADVISTPTILGGGYYGGLTIGNLTNMPFDGLGFCFFVPWGRNWPSNWGPCGCNWSTP